MKQRKHITIFLIALLSLIMWSCEKNIFDVDLKSSSWKVVKIKNQNDSSYIEASESYVLVFSDDATYTLSLDVNNCFGDYEIINNSGINISAMGCTEICCDSEFAENLMQLLPQMTRFYQKGNELIFEGEGEIIFENE
jgi:heat shock protein HslJ